LFETIDDLLTQQFFRLTHTRWSSKLKFLAELILGHRRIDKSVLLKSKFIAELIQYVQRCNADG